MVTTDILEIPTSKSNSCQARYHFCKVSSSLQHFDYFEILDIFAVSMAMAAMFLIPKSGAQLDMVINIML